MVFFNRGKFSAKTPLTLLLLFQVFRGGGSHITRHAGSGDPSLHGRAVEHGPVQNHRRAPHALGECHSGEAWTRLFVIESCYQWEREAA